MCSALWASTPGYAVQLMAQPISSNMKARTGYAYAVGTLRPRLTSVYETLSQTILLHHT